MKLNWIEFNNTWEEFEDAGLVNPGTLVEVEQKERPVRRYLIGDINDSSGLCGCCRLYMCERVIRYAVLDLDNLE